MSQLEMTNEIEIEEFNDEMADEALDEAGARFACICYFTTK
jgi:hypothetical protein